MKKLNKKLIQLKSTNNNLNLNNKILIRINKTLTKYHKLNQKKAINQLIILEYLMNLMTNLYNWYNFIYSFL